MAPVSDRGAWRAIRKSRAFGDVAPCLRRHPRARLWRGQKKAVPAMTDLERFVTAQDQHWSGIRAELQAGRKTSHWMWYVFPQLAGLGASATSRFYALPSLEAARAYLAHPVLGPRLLDCTRLVVAAKGRSVHAIFGSPDDLKFHASMTLFHLADPAVAEFSDALAAHFEGRPHAATQRLLGE